MTKRIAFLKLWGSQPFFHFSKNIPKSNFLFNFQLETPRGFYFGNNPRVDQYAKETRLPTTPELLTWKLAVEQVFLKQEEIRLYRDFSELEFQKEKRKNKQKDIFELIMSLKKRRRRRRRRGKKKIRIFEEVEEEDRPFQRIGNQLDIVEEELGDAWELRAQTFEQHTHSVCWGDKKKVGPY